MKGLIGHHLEAVLPSFLELLVELYDLGVLALALAVLNGLPDVLAPHELSWLAMEASLDQVTIVIACLFVHRAASFLLASH